LTPPIDETWIIWPRFWIAHVREHSLRYPKRAEEVGFQLRARFGLAHLFDRAEEAVAGIVDGDVDAPEASDRLRHGGIDRGLVRHVELYCRRTISVTLFECTYGSCVARRCCYAITSLERRLGPNAAKSFRRARNKPNFACHGLRHGDLSLNLERDLDLDTSYTWCQNRLDSGRPSRWLDATLVRKSCCDGLRSWSTLHERQHGVGPSIGRKIKAAGAGGNDRAVAYRKHLPVEKNYIVMNLYLADALSPTLDFIKVWPGARITGIPG
jgi:hypothetical protein